ncbi:hypothetical protein T440DRAFT_537739 [Plenodomus tracheiphilus IPT5]|uniref:DUF7730 domain-containing protein n=1 Tax=Plenodomus tracheiphilus IPT5 TaxID=1408161 RepID=A0A6A7B0C0_9PLEO|nr:hypothetical protein T440DRAFT_537739 [Plenodomus tracheiphilus IPT5]
MASRYSEGHLPATTSQPPLKTGLSNEEADVMYTFLLVALLELVNCFLSTPRNQQKSSLLRLPPELRNRIYSYAYSEDRVEVYKSDGSRWDPSQVDAWTHERSSPYENLGIMDLLTVLATTAVCRQIYARAHLLPFRLNIFYLEGVVSIAYIRHVWSQKQRQAIGKLRP